MTTNAVGIDMAFPSNNYVRNHLGLAHQWEKLGPIRRAASASISICSATRINLLSSDVRLDLEPILTVLRGEIMWVEGGDRFLRVESGFGLELSATLRRWFLSVQPLAVDSATGSGAAEIGDRLRPGFPAAHRHRSRVLGRRGPRTPPGT